MSIKPSSASLLVTEDCNMACKYCFELKGRNKKSMTEEIGYKSIDFLFNNALETKSSHIYLMLFGGEPFLQVDLMDKMLMYAIEKCKPHNIQVQANIVTNATIYNDKVDKFLRKYIDLIDLNTQLSVDGIKVSHDENRVFKNGQGSYDTIFKNIPKFKSAYSKKPHSINIHGCCNGENIHFLYENYMHFRHVFGLERIWFMPIHNYDWKEEHVDIYKQQLSMISDYILEKAKMDNSAAEVYNYAPLDRCFYPDAFGNAPCGAGKSFITITADGSIYPCHGFYFNDPEKETYMGNIYEGINQEKNKIFEMYDCNDLNCDKDCDCFQCYRCIADNWVENGSILASIKGLRCKMSKIERELQKKTKEELKNMGLLNTNNQNGNSGIGNNPDNPACLCDSGGSSGLQEKPADLKDNCENGCCEIDNEETLAKALKYIIEKLDLLEIENKLILKKLL